jgi:hypothetical protein
MFSLFSETKNPPCLPKSLEHWFADMTNVEKLRDLLRDPVFQTAAASLISAAQPAYACTIQPTEINDRRQAWLAGYNDAFRDLLKLTKAPVPRAGSTLPDEWSHIRPQQD